MNSKLIKNLLVVLLICSLLGLTALNIYSSFFKKDLYANIKQSMYSLNLGESYKGRLNFWRLLVQNGDWSNASVLESKLDPQDINSYKTSHQPQELKKTLKTLQERPEKTADDWVEIAKTEAMLGKIAEAKSAMSEAYKLDPVREDISKLYYSVNRN